MTPMFRCSTPIKMGGHGLSFTKRCACCAPATRAPQLYSMGNDLLRDDPATHKNPPDLAAAG
jgi:hypothetical protein